MDLTQVDQLTKFKKLLNSVEPESITVISNKTYIDNKTTLAPSFLFVL